MYMATDSTMMAMRKRFEKHYGLQYRHPTNYNILIDYLKTLPTYSRLKPKQKRDEMLQEAFTPKVIANAELWTGPNGKGVAFISYSDYPLELITIAVADILNDLGELFVIIPHCYLADHIATCMLIIGPNKTATITHPIKT